VTSLVHQDAPTRHDALTRAVRRGDDELAAAWRAVIEAPALQAAQLRREIDAVTDHAINGVKRELRAVISAALHDHAVLAISAAFVVGAVLGHRR
jgi:hypothetical protein